MSGTCRRENIRERHIPTTTKLMLLLLAALSNSLITSRPLLLGGGTSVILSPETLLDNWASLSFGAAPSCTDFGTLGAACAFFPAAPRVRISPSFCLCKTRTFCLCRKNNVVGAGLGKSSGVVRRRMSVGHSKELPLRRVWSRSRTEERSGEC